MPKVVTIPTSMHIGKPAKPVVSAGDTVKVGQLIAEADGFVSSPVYSGVSGAVKKIDSILMSGGQRVPAIIIETDGLQMMLEGIAPPKVTNTEEFLAAVRMGLAATAVLVCSNIAISALRKVIPDNVRIPCYIVLIAGFVTVVEMLVKAYAPALDESLGIYLPLIVVNCIILGRAEMFANKNTVIDSALDGIGMQEQNGPMSR